jgi:hypothetical protein
LLAALDELNAMFGDPRRIKPNRSHRESLGHKLLETDHGVLDVLATIETNTTYGDLVKDCEWFEVAGVRVRVLSLERLIRVKEQLDRPKDRAMLDVLRATFEETKKSS